MKITLNKDKQIVDVIKEGLEHTADIAPAVRSARRKQNVCAGNLRSRLKILNSKASVTACSIINQLRINGGLNGIRKNCCGE